jgi:hypothetical protein
MAINNNTVSSTVCILCLFVATLALVRAQPSSSPTWTAVSTSAPSGCTSHEFFVYSILAINSASYIEYVTCLSPSGSTFVPNSYDSGCAFCYGAPISLDAGSDSTLIAADVGGNLWVNNGGGSFSSLAKANSNFAVQVSIGSANWVSYIDTSGNAYYLKDGLSGGMGWYTLSGYYTDFSIGLDGYCASIQQHSGVTYYDWCQLSVSSGCITSGTLPSGFSPTGVYVFNSYNVIGFDYTTIAWLLGGLHAGSSWRVLPSPSNLDGSTYGSSMFYPSVGAGIIGYIATNGQTYKTTFPMVGCTYSCSAGTYSVCGTTTCASCSAGTYEASSGATVCTSCPGGTYSTAVAATSVAACVNCGGGTYSTPKSSSCAECVEGSWSETGYSVCTCCVPGRWNNPGESGCFGCPDCETNHNYGDCLPGNDNACCPYY